MKIDQSNKLKMAQATRACMGDEHNASLWQGITGIEEAVASLDDTVEKILERSVKQSERSGSGAEKEDARQTMLNAAFTVCSGLKAYAAANGNKKLADQADFSRSDLARGRESDMINRCQSLLTLGNENSAALAAKYNVAAKDLTALETAIGNFTGVQPKPRQSRAASAAATAELFDLFKQLDEVLNGQLDPLMEKFQQSAPAFYNEYRTARIIVDDAATHESPAKATASAQTQSLKAA
jgi:hypothetical protein